MTTADGTATEAKLYERISHIVAAALTLQGETLTVGDGVSPRRIG